MNTKEEAMSILVSKGYWRIVDMGDTHQGVTKVEVCSADHAPLINLQQIFGGTIKKQDSIWRWSCGKAVDLAHVAVNLAPIARALAVEMHRYCSYKGKRRYGYVQGIKEKYGTRSIKISNYTDEALGMTPPHSPITECAEG